MLFMFKRLHYTKVIRRFTICHSPFINNIPKLYSKSSRYVTFEPLLYYLSTHYVIENPLLFEMPLVSYPNTIESRKDI